MDDWEIHFRDKSRRRARRRHYDPTTVGIVLGTTIALVAFLAIMLR